MKEISKSYALINGLRKRLIIHNEDMSKIVLAIERLKENKEIKYYSVDLIIFNQIKHKGDITISFYGD